MMRPWIALFPVVAAAASASADPVTDPVPCVDDSEVIGYRDCTPYGAWSREVDEPDIFIEYGLLWRHLDSGGGSTRSLRTSSTTSTTPRKQDGGGALVVDERLGVSGAYGAYVAADVEIGDFAADGSESNRDILIGAAGSVGFRGRLGGLSLGAELTGGYRGTSAVDNHDLDGSPVFEARARGSLWLTPWVTLGGVAGSSLLDRGEWMVGVMLGFHGHAYGLGY